MYTTNAAGTPKESIPPDGARYPKDLIHHKQ